jgi:heat shock protein HslJ/uncharacterized lipoprotein YbaY
MVLEADGRLALLGVDTVDDLQWWLAGDTLHVAARTHDGGAPQATRLTVGAVDRESLRLEGQGFFAREFRRADTAAARIDGQVMLPDGAALHDGAELRLELLHLGDPERPRLVASRSYPVTGREAALPFRFHYLRDSLEKEGQYGLVATLAVDGVVRYATTDPSAVAAGATSGRAQLALQPVSAAAAARWSPRDLGPLPRTFAGDLPCTSCRAIRTAVTMDADGRYRLREQSLANDGTLADTYLESGYWETAQQATLLLLRGPAAEPRVFAFAPGPRLRLLDARGAELDSAQRFVLDASAHDPIDAARPAPDTTPPVALTGTGWWLLTVGDALLVTEQAQRIPRLFFDAASGRVTGSTGCNRLFGRFSVAGDALALPGVAATRMACPDGLEVEQALLQALAATARYRLHRNRLDLRDAAGRLLAHWIAAPGG